MYNPIYVSNNFLSRSFEQDVPVTSMKIQKMLYFLYRDYLKATNIPIFSERFSTWKYGPVLESVYYTYKKYGDTRIMTYGGSPPYKIKENSDPTLKKYLDDIWGKSLKHNGISLSQLTHQKGSAWYDAWITNDTFLQDTDIKNDNIEL